MLNLFGVNVATVMDSEKRNKIQEILAQNNIKYNIKTEYINQRNAFDSAIMGNRGNSTKLKYMFYVNKKDADMAVNLLVANKITNILLILSRLPIMTLQ